MPSIKYVLGAAIALSVSSSPVLAAAQISTTAPAQPKASKVLKGARTGAVTESANQLDGGGTFLAIAAAVAVGLGIYVAVDGGDDTPASP